MKSTLSIVSGLLFLVGFIPYIVVIIRGVAKPSKASWLIWASLDGLALAGMYAEGAVNGQIIGATLGASLTALLAIKYGAPGWSRLDKLCLASAVLGVILWAVFDSPMTALLITMAVAIVGGIPTVTAAWRDPGREDRLAWTIFWLSCVCACLAIPRWTLADAAQPLTFTAIESSMMAILWLKPRSPKVEPAQAD